ncbi:hypothetical protein SAMN05216176_1294 [Nitratireductor indicus]|nr:hypothetical protein SAMN05216176_1294 [Nitratireductor indicus]
MDKAHGLFSIRFQWSETEGAQHQRHPLLYAA